MQENPYQKLLESYQNMLTLAETKPASAEVIKRLEEISENIKSCLAECGYKERFLSKDIEDEAYNFFFGKSEANTDNFVSYIKKQNETTINVGSILSYFSNLIEKAIENESTEEIIEKLGINHETTDRVLLVPKSNKKFGEAKSNRLQKELTDINKTALLLQMLIENGVKSEQINIVSGIIEDNMVRKSTYYCIEILHKNIKIFVNNEYAEATFIITGEIKWEKLIGASKEEIEKTFNARKIIFFDNQIDKWLSNLKDYIFNIPDLMYVVQSDINSSLQSTDFSSSYFNNIDKVKYDLNLFAEAQNKKINSLSLSNKQKIICSNGKKTTIDSYIREAAFYKGLAISKTEARKNKPEVYIELLKMIGCENIIIEKMDRSYFLDKEKVKHDLEQFSLAIGKSVLELTPGVSTINFKKAKCSNNEEINFAVYISRAMKSLNLKSREAALEHLLNISSYKKPLEIKMDYIYFENSTYVKNDLINFAKNCGLEVFDLKPTSSCTTRCSNSEEITLDIYIARAGKKLGICRTSEEARKKGVEILDQLFKIADITRMDKLYFNNIDNIREDLNKYAKKAGREISELSLYFEDLNIKCSNGEYVLFKTYLNRANRLLGLHLESQREILNYLLEILNIKAKPFIIEMGDSYFTKENVRYDLEEFAKEIGVEVLKLPVNSKKSIICANGQELKFSTYRNKAGMSWALGNSREVNSMGRFILNKLQRLAGFNPFDDVYFNDYKSVKFDLQKYANELGVDILKLPIESNKSIVCSNGLKLSLNVYLLTAGLALGFGKRKNNLFSKKQEILDSLYENLSNNK